MIWYRIHDFSETPEPINVIKETKCYIQREGYKNKDSKISDFWCYFHTKKEAIDWRIKRFQEKISTLKKQLEVEEKKLHSFLVRNDREPHVSIGDLRVACVDLGTGDVTVTTSAHVEDGDLKIDDIGKVIPVDILSAEIYVKKGKPDCVCLQANVSSPFPDSSSPLWLSFNAPEKTGKKFVIEKFGDILVNMHEETNDVALVTNNDYPPIRDE